MRIAFVIRSLVRGGAERQVVDLSKHLSQLGHACFVFTFLGEPSEWRAELDESRVRVVDLEAGRTYWRGIAALRRALVEHEIDVLNSHLAVAGGFAAVGCRLARVPSVFTVQNLEVAQPRSVRLAGAIARRHARCVVCVSETVRADVVTAPRLRRVSSNRAVVIYNGVDVARLERASREIAALDVRRGWGVDDQDAVVLTVGRFEESKGHDLLIRAMRRVVEKVTRAKLVLVGWGPLERRLRDEAARCGLAGRVIFVPAGHEVPAFVAAADVFAFPSLWEGLGIALLEAMALRTPVVANGIAPLTEVVRDGRDGLLVDVRTEQALADALVELLTQPERAAGLADSAYRRVVSEFAVGDSARRYEALFERVTRPGRSQGAESRDARAAAAP